MRVEVSWAIIAQRMKVLQQPQFSLHKIPLSILLLWLNPIGSFLTIQFGFVNASRIPGFIICNFFTRVFLKVGTKPFFVLISEVFFKESKCSCYLLILNYQFMTWPIWPIEWTFCPSVQKYACSASYFSKCLKTTFRCYKLLFTTRVVLQLAQCQFW